MYKEFNKTSRIIIGVVLAVVIWIAGILIGQEQTVTILNPEGGLRGLIVRTRSIRVNLMFDYGDGFIKVFSEVPMNYGQNVLQLLEKADKLENNELKVEYELSEDNIISNFSISDFTNISDGKNWTIWLNNQMQTKPLNDIRLKAKDVIELKYVKLRN